MTAIDWVLLAIVAISALLGLMRGFVGVMLSLVSWVLAGAVAYGFGDDAAVMLAETANPSMGYVVGGYVLCFGTVLVSVKLLSWFIRRLLESVGLSSLDRGLGLAFGVLRGALFACALVLLMGFTSLPGDAQWHRSQTIPLFEPGARWLRDLLPAAIAQQVSFDSAGPLSGDRLRQQSRALGPLVDGGGMLGQDPNELLRSLGGRSADHGAAPAGQALPLPLPDLQNLPDLQGLDGLQSLEDLMPRPDGSPPRAGNAPAPAVDPANVDAGNGLGGQAYDPAAVDGPSSGPSPQRSR
ncbi:CvpA family protein [Marilutibacter chinensis]|uniref:CvpA family protein n=1 Tax=Marilutibacter chinensis TaxID=2912247 RepID=A0ABS9HRI7_9GAMM|nr:CvpA family protein [Lysobacter chinensis]MCF7221263.1 CvpA family protein [Lysobacter chinensis]MCF7222996.1 CvpA family protein [Lysobacter chinensis]